MLNTESGVTPEITMSGQRNKIIKKQTNKEKDRRDKIRKKSLVRSSIQNMKWKQYALTCPSMTRPLCTKWDLWTQVVFAPYSNRNCVYWFALHFFFFFTILLHLNYCILSRNVWTRWHYSTWNWNTNFAPELFTAQNLVSNQSTNESFIVAYILQYSEIHMLQL